jgi:transcriptional regulator with XRE-family HTH domain
MSTAAALIREGRRRAGISQTELARRAGVSRTTVNAYERGRREPGVEALARLLRSAGLRLEVARYPDAAEAGRDLEDLLGLVDAIEVERPRRPLRFPPFTRP